MRIQNYQRADARLRIRLPPPGSDNVVSAFTTSSSIVATSTSIPPSSSSTATTSTRPIFPWKEAYSSPPPSFATSTPFPTAAPEGLSITTDIRTDTVTDISETTAWLPQPSNCFAANNYSTCNPIGPDQWARFSQGVKAAIIIAGIFGIVAIVIASIWFCCGKPRRRRVKAEEDMEIMRRRLEAESRGVVPGVQVPLRNLEGGVGTGGSGSGDARRSIAPVAARGAVGRVASRLSRHVSLRSNAGTVGGGADAPPRYEEHVPPAHQRLAGGMVRRGDQNQISPMMEEEDGMGVVADGKTPLSEIPFEDVVLTPTRSQASASGSASPSGSGSGSGRDFGNRHAMENTWGNTHGHTNA